MRSVPEGAPWNPSFTFPVLSDIMFFLEAGKEQEFDTLFEKALNEVKASFGSRNPMYIGGRACDTLDSLVHIGIF